MVNKSIKRLKKVIICTKDQIIVSFAKDIDLKKVMLYTVTVKQIRKECLNEYL